MNGLTNSQKQSMLHMIKREITVAHIAVEIMQQHTKEFYALADIDKKDDENVKLAFENLNIYRNEIRRMKVEIKKMAGIAKQLKFELRRVNKDTRFVEELQKTINKAKTKVLNVLS